MTGGCWSTRTCTWPGCPTLSADWRSWAQEFGDPAFTGLFDAEGRPRPEAVDEFFDGQGADHVLLFSEYSPKATGIQPIEDLLPLVAASPARFRPVACINPHLHYPPAAELARQVGLGAVACKIHPVHGGFEPGDRMLYPAYAWAEEHRPAGHRALRHVHLRRVDSTPTATRPCSTRCSATSPASRWCWRTAAGAGGTSRPRSWP